MHGSKVVLMNNVIELLVLQGSWFEMVEFHMGNIHNIDHIATYTCYILF